MKLSLLRNADATDRNEESMDRNGKVADSAWELTDSGWELTDSSWDFPRGAAGGGRMSFCQAFPTTRDPHWDARTVNSTRNDHSTMDAARVPNKKGSLSAPSIVAYENGG
jgi:hypothetical protein